LSKENENWLIQETVIIDEVVKSRHSRLSGIVVFFNVLKRNDSGQAGMTSKEGL